MPVFPSHVRFIHFTAILVVFTLLLLGLRAQGSASGDDKIVEHLEFLGYQCETLEQGIKASHDLKLGFVLLELRDGIIAQSAFAGKNSGGDSASRFAAINSLNKTAATARFFWADSGELVMRAWLPGAYDKSRFTIFIEAWEKDGLTLRTTYDELKTYLK